MMIVAVQGYRGAYKLANADITLANLQTALNDAKCEGTTGRTVNNLWR